MTRRSFFAALGGLFAGGALPATAEAAKPDTIAAHADAVPGMTVHTYKRNPHSKWETRAVLHIDMPGDDDADFVVLGIRTDEYEKLQKGAR